MRPVILTLATALRSLPAAAFLFGAILFSLPSHAADGLQAQDERKTLVVLGDSLAAGLGVEREEAFPALLQKKVDAAGLPYTVVNAGVSGDTSAGGLGRIDWLLRRKIDVLLIELGANDGLRGIPVYATRTNLQAIIDRVKQVFPTARVVIAGMQMPPNLGETYTTAFREIYPELARTNKASLIPFLLEGVGGNPDLNQDDRMHPTAEGHKVVAENVWKVLQPILSRKDSTAARELRESLMSQSARSSPASLRYKVARLTPSSRAACSLSPDVSSSARFK